MKKLKCTSCNGDLELDENKEIGTCKYCGTKYKLNDDKTITIKLDDNIKIPKVPHVNVKDIDKAFYPVIAIISAIFILIVSLIIIFGVKTYNKQQVTRFNFDLSFGSGGKQGAYIYELLDKVNNKNNTNNKHKITVVYDGQELNGEKEINKFKYRLQPFTTYEVSYSYDSKGYINKISIQDIS